MCEANQVRACADTREAEMWRGETRATRIQHAWCSVRLHCTFATGTRAFPVHVDVTGQKWHKAQGQGQNMAREMRRRWNATAAWRTSQRYCVRFA